MREKLGLREPAPTLASQTPASQTLASAPAAVAEIVVSRCSMCHADTPVWPGVSIAPKGVLLDTPERVERWRAQVLLQAAFTRAMPPNNLTEITEEERAILRAWGAPAKGAAS
jgi:uncharacterized membrane protein